MSQASSALAPDTFPKYLIRNAQIFADRPAMREKFLGIWQTWTWKDNLANTSKIAGGLIELGVRRGDKVAILGDNRPRLYATFGAIQALGATPVPIYQDSVAEEVQYVLDHAEVRFAVVEDQEQVDKLLSIKDRTKLEKIVYDDPRGMRHYTQPGLIEMDALMRQGDTYAASHPGFFAAEAAQGKGSDLALIAYTSGTTGRPKGVMLSFDNLAKSAELAVAFDGFNPSDDVLSYLPLAWVGDNFISYCEGHVAGFCINCPESGDTLLIDLKEIGPTYYFGPPRIWENLLTSVLVRMEDSGAFKKVLFDYFIDHARKCGRDILEKKPVGLFDRLAYGLGELLVYGPLKNTLGLSRIRVAYTAGEALGPDVFNFYRSIGINLKQLYGQTECSVYLCLHSNDDVRSDTVGPPAPGTEVRIDETGEVLYRSPGVFVGYYKNEEATREAKTADGWVHTGDAGVFTDDGHLRIIDRVKDVGRLNDGTLFPPKYIENKLKFFPQIKEAVTFGHQKDFVTAFINIDLGAVGNWAERNGIAYTSYADLTSRDEVCNLIKGCIEQVNRDLAQDAAMVGTQIKRFLILHKELDADDGELTRTRKVRRRFVAERFEPLINALYSGLRSISVEAKVTFEDGRSGSFNANVKITDAEVFAHMKKAG